MMSVFVQFYHLFHAFISNFASYIFQDIFMVYTI